MPHDKRRHAADRFDAAVNYRGMLNHAHVNSNIPATPQQANSAASTAAIARLILCSGVKSMSDLSSGYAAGFGARILEAEIGRRQLDLGRSVGQRSARRSNTSCGMAFWNWQPAVKSSAHITSAAIGPTSGRVSQIVLPFFRPE